MLFVVLVTGCLIIIVVVYVDRSEVDRSVVLFVKKFNDK